MTKLINFLFFFFSNSTVKTFTLLHNIEYKYNKVREFLCIFTALNGTYFEKNYFRLFSQSQPMH